MVSSLKHMGQVCVAQIRKASARMRPGGVAGGHVVHGLAIVVLVLSFVGTEAIARVTFASKEAAFTQGYSAYKGRQYEIAVPALQFAAKQGVMRAKFYLAKIYSDNSGGWTDHARAYGLLRDIVAGLGDVDPKDFRIAPFVSQALTSMARYERDGIKQLNLKPDTKRALKFFDYAASYFGDEDAQFELAKHYLAGDGVRARVPYALNWLAKLSKRGHAGAQAFLANLYWDGRYTLRDPVRALALITVAVENAKEEDRFWIDDVHQNIFCEANTETRRRVHQVVGGWRQRFGRNSTLSVVDRSDEASLADLLGRAKRICANGDIVGDLNPAPTVGRESDMQSAAVPLDSGAVNASVLTGSALTGRAELGSATGVVSPSAATATQSLNRAKPSDPVLMTRIKPDRSDKSALNGFVLREAERDDKGQLSLPVRSATTVGRGRDYEPQVDRSHLNGFVLQGNSSSLGFATKPRP